MTTTYPPTGTAAIAAVLIVLTGLAAGCGGDDGVSPTPAETMGQDLAVQADTYTDTANPNQAHGNDTVLNTGAGRTTYLKFSLAALDPDAVVTGLRLHLSQTAATAAAAGTVTVEYLPDDGWTETDATANNPPAAPDGTLGSSDVDALAAGATRDVVVTAATGLDKISADWHHGNRVVSLRVTSSTALSFRSANHGLVDDEPRLEIEYARGHRLSLQPLADAFVNHSSHDPQAPATGPYLVVSTSDYMTFLKFDLAGVPDGARVHAAQLVLTARQGYAYGGDGNVYTRHVADDSWTEATLSSANAPSAAAEHVGYWWLWYGSDPPVDKVGTNRTAQLRALVAAEAAGDDLLSLRLDSPGYWTSYYSRSEAEVAKRPRLEVLYTR
ncbi:MAG: DNRLRE domain-containing protein [Krumholzibacteria bacterium]|nr:DNRLRE domain-containing protein [Candidatus Krumholzibacteria bacterium]